MIGEKLTPFGLYVNIEFHVIPELLSDVIGKLENGFMKSYTISSPTQHGIKIVVRYMHTIQRLDSITNTLIERLEVKDRTEVFKRLSGLKHAIIGLVKISVETKSIKKIRFA